MRLFFACWPPAGTAQALAAWAREAQRACGGRVARPENIHLTLAFLGDAEPALARARGAGVRLPASALCLGLAGHWAHNRIVWAGPQETPAPLAQLARALGESRPFAAHVTLIRKARSPGPLPQLPALAWPVDHFTLVSSVLGRDGPSYEILERYALE